MKINILKNYWEMGEVVSDTVEHTLTLPEPKLALPTGSTPLSLYKELVNRDLDWSSVITFNLDEYIINPNHPESYHSFMRGKFFNRINIYPNSCHFPDRNTQWYEDKIAGTMGGGTGSGIDLCILGIGTNGHVAFNEPGSSFDSRTRVVDLSEQTIKDNSRFFDSVDDVPTQAITMGLGTIMESKKIVLMANGEHKLNILNVAMNGEVTEDVPASILQNHKNVKIYYCE
jgi:glucosamine-6-phosphate deaminase